MGPQPHKRPLIHQASARPNRETRPKHSTAPTPRRADGDVPDVTATADHASSQSPSTPRDTPADPYRPAAHTPHTGDPADVLVYPTCAASHDTHADSADAPSSLEYLPAAHSLHDVAP